MSIRTRIGEFSSHWIESYMHYLLHCLWIFPGPSTYGITIWCMVYTSWNTALYMNFPSIYIYLIVFEIDAYFWSAYKLSSCWAALSHLSPSMAVVKTSKFPHSSSSINAGVWNSNSHILWEPGMMSRFNSPPLHLSHMLHAICEKYPSSFPIKLTSVFTYKQTQKSLPTVLCFVYNPII